MSSLLTVLTVLIVCITVLAIAFLVLLSLPNSKLRSVLLEAFSWGTAGVAAASVVSPIDLVPDFIPVLGQIDDIGAIIAGLIAIGFAVYQRHNRNQLRA
jgi:uncharacterized membrane protein YkvA (DUF1232 family)